SARTLSSLLSVAAHLGHVAGADPSGASFVSSSAVEPGLDRDLIVVGTDAEQPLLSGWHDHAVALPAAGQLMVRPSSVLGRIWARLWAGQARSPAVDRTEPVGIVSSFESPVHRGRTVLVVTGTRDNALPELATMAASRFGWKQRSDLAVTTGDNVRVFRSEDAYLVGHLGPVGRVLWFFS